MYNEYRPANTENLKIKHSECFSRPLSCNITLGCASCNIADKQKSYDDKKVMMTKLILDEGIIPNEISNTSRGPVKAACGPGPRDVLDIS